MAVTSCCSEWFSFEAAGEEKKSAKAEVWPASADVGEQQGAWHLKSPTLPSSSPTGSWGFWGLTFGIGNHMTYVQISPRLTVLLEQTSRVILGITVAQDSVDGLIAEVHFHAVCMSSNTVCTMTLKAIRHLNNFLLSVVRLLLWNYDDYFSLN